MDPNLADPAVETARYLSRPVYDAVCGKTWSCGSIFLGQTKVHVGEASGLVSKGTTVVLVEDPYAVSGSFNEERPKDVDFLRGDFTYAPNHSYSSSVAKASGSVAFICVADDWIANLTDAYGGGSAIDQPRTATSGLAHAHYYSTAIRDFLASDGFGGRLRAEALMTLLFGDMYEILAQKRTRRAVPDLSERAIAQVTEFIDTQSDSKIRIKDLAEIANMSEFHFARVFKETTGLPPHQYVMRHRLQKVQAELAETPKSLAEIAYECGFSSQSHMSSAFQKHFGTPPGRYRAILRD